MGKIPVDLGYPCPNRAQGGCIFCFPESFTPGYLNKEHKIETQIEKGKKNILKNRFRLYLAYFQQESCTVAPVSELLKTIEKLLQDQDCKGVIISTRPDCIQEELLAPLARIINASGKECLFELGLQSAHDKSLIRLNRNHTVKDFTNALEAIKTFQEFSVGAHLIFGIPGETWNDMIETIQFIAQCDLQSLKLHHLQVIRNTELHKMYLRGDITLFDRQTYMQLLLDVLPMIPPDAIIHRLWASSHPELLIAPKWNILATHLSRELLSLMQRKGIRQGCAI